MLEKGCDCGGFGLHSALCLHGEVKARRNSIDNAAEGPAWVLPSVRARTGSFS